MPAKTRWARFNFPGRTMLFCVPGKGIESLAAEHPGIRYTESVYKMPKRGVIGEPAWGTVDGWRRPRPEYWLSKKLYSPVQIEEKPLAIPEAGKPIVVPVRNWNQFADLDQYVCRWELAGEKGEARAKAAPMSKGTLEIAVKRPPQPDDKLALRVLQRPRQDGRCLPACVQAARDARISQFRQARANCRARRLPRRRDRPSACLVPEWNWPTIARAENFSAP